MNERAISNDEKEWPNACYVGGNTRVRATESNGCSRPELVAPVRASQGLGGRRLIETGQLATMIAAKGGAATGS